MECCWFVLVVFVAVIVVIVVPVAIFLMLINIIFGFAIVGFLCDVVACRGVINFKERHRRCVC